MLQEWLATRNYGWCYARVHLHDPTSSVVYRVLSCDPVRIGDSAGVRLGGENSRKFR
jgi:hypothetical protein